MKPVSEKVTTIIIVGIVDVQMFSLIATNIDTLFMELFL